MWLSVCSKVINKWVEMKSFNILRIISFRLKTWWWLVGGGVMLSADRQSG